MTRKTEDPTRSRQRAKVADAMKNLRPLLKVAMASDHEADWEAVELQAATIHRQSRLLAGKSRGG